MITLYQATTEDIGILRDIAAKTWFVTYRDILSSEQMHYMFDWMYSIESLEQQISVLNHVFFIASINKRPLGFVSIEKQTGNLFHLHKLYTLPESQGLGIGRILIHKAFDFAKKNAEGGICALELNVNRKNKALTFYQKMGMHISDEGDFDIGRGYYMNDYILRIDFPIGS